QVPPSVGLVLSMLNEAVFAAAPLFPVVSVSVMVTVFAPVVVPLDGTGMEQVTCGLAPASNWQAPVTVPLPKFTDQLAAESASLAALLALVSTTVPLFFTLAGAAVHEPASVGAVLSSEKVGPVMLLLAFPRLSVSTMVVAMLVVLVVALTA